MKRAILSPMIALLFLGVGLGAANAHDDEPIGQAVSELPLFDAHIHYKEPAWNAYPVESIISLMDRNGVAMGLVSSTPDDETIKLWEHAPQRVVPELRPYHDDVGSSNWTGFPNMKAYLEDRLERYPHQGIGEFHIRNRSMWDEDLFKDLIKIAKERDIFLHVHSGAEPIRWLYDLDPNVKIIWAHASLGEPSSVVYDLMHEYPNLLADTSLREYSILGTGLGAGNDLDPDWKKIIFDFQDRLMIGSDTWVNSQWDNYDAIMTSNRLWLSKLPRTVAEKIAYKNAERVFNRTISNDLIGQR